MDKNDIIKMLSDMHKTKDFLPEIFAKYAGVEIPHEAHEREMRSGRKITTQRPTPEGQRIIREIYETAAKNNIELRLLTPTGCGDFEIKTGRLNMYLDGNWVVKNEHNYG